MRKKQDLRDNSLLLASCIYYRKSLQLSQILLHFWFLFTFKIIYINSFISRIQYVLVHDYLNSSTQQLVSYIWYMIEWRKL